MFLVFLVTNPCLRIQSFFSYANGPNMAIGSEKLERNRVFKNLGNPDDYFFFPYPGDIFLGVVIAGLPPLLPFIRKFFLFGYFWIK